MPHTPHIPASQPLPSRRALLRASLALTAATLMGCTPLKLAAQHQPCSPADALSGAYRVLNAFAQAIVPDAGPDMPSLTRVLYDPYFPFAPYVEVFIDDLCRRARHRHKFESFDTLDLPTREGLVAEAVAHGGLIRRLYVGAIFLTQASFYADIYEQSGGCAAIGFEVPYRFVDFNCLTYPDTETFLAFQETCDGNPT